MDKKTLLTKANEYIASEEDSRFSDEIKKLISDENYEELNERFYTELEFGTGGLRGVIGGGYNRMNPYVVGRATQGLASYIRKHAGEKSGSVVIAYDSRRYSDLFALEAARVLCGNGLTVYLFTGLRPTPELSFAVRKLGATAGIVVTASHNPPQYNGYKVYWEDGGQIVAPHDKGIIEEVRKVENVSMLSRQDAIERGLLNLIDKEIDEPFIQMIVDRSLRPNLAGEKGSEVKIVYTPLHGTGTLPVAESLSRLGIQVMFVKEQKEPDGNFPTVKVPNPEEAEALSMALELARKNKAQLVLATDPDADRLGIAVAQNDEFTLVNGNQLGVLLLDYVVNARSEKGTMPKKPAFVKTIVTTDLQRKIAESKGVTCFNTLTGFKYIGEKIRQFESEENGYEYIFGGEESYGYLANTEVRDKDAVSAACLTAEMTLYHLTQGKTLLDRLDEIYAEYGYYKELLISKYFEGQEGLATMQRLMEKLRKNPPKEFAGQSVEAMKDYKDGTTLNLAASERTGDIDLPSSNVLQFILTDESVITARPSGTEPKIKFYASCCSKPGEDLSSARASVNGKIEKIRSEIDALIGSA